MMDVSGALAGIALALPVMAAVNVVVWFTMGRPTTIRQVRAGQLGRPITILKFRTMTNAVDELGQLAPDDVRLTDVGRRLRGWSLDELPQLVNVVRGDMSLVGPRPLPLSYVDRYSDRQRRRLSARPGLTGWSQVNGRNAVAWPTKLEQDVWYVEHASWRLDLKILSATVRGLRSPTGITADGHVSMPEFMGEH